jgi:hypothetical protein
LQALLNQNLSAQMTAGVRALFTGPSGSGKTLSARLLAASLKMDLYRLDLSSVVNKYIGETEKNLNQVFSRAEELDVILLIDEGDALLTQRTGVQTSNDRYANLETNYRARLRKENCTDRNQQCQRPHRHGVSTPHGRGSQLSRAGRRRALADLAVAPAGYRRD